MTRATKGATAPAKRPPGRPWTGHERGVRVVLLLPPSLLARVDTTRALDGLTRTDVIRAALEAWEGLEPPGGRDGT